MKVGFLHDNPGYLGGAELTMAEYKAAAPEGVEVIDCPPGNVLQGLDRYVLGNVQTYAGSKVSIEQAGMWATMNAVRYHHDVSHAWADHLLGSNARHIFCSPLQRKRMKMEGECIPPALDLAPFEAVANRNHRKGAVCVGRMAYGKGLDLLAEYEEPVDIYSSVPCRSQGNARYLGPTSDVADTLSKYERFIFLPTAIEPFGRAVVEAWAAGLQVIVNGNVGARYWIEENPQGLASASKDFWRVVCQ